MVEGQSVSVKNAIIIGSTGGIGEALTRQLTAQGHTVTALSRTTTPPIDFTDEPTIAAAATQLAASAPFDLIIVATGILQTATIAPEKTFRDLTSATLATYFAINATGPALIAKHFLPLLPKSGRGVFAALSARVGSITDNRLGGWYGYRASKAALNMLMKTLAIELPRSRPEAICVALHPGTVDTPLSKPFQRGVVPEKLFTADHSAEQLLKVIDRLTAEQSGDCFAWDGQRVLP